MRGYISKTRLRGLVKVKNQNNIRSAVTPLFPCGGGTVVEQSNRIFWWIVELYWCVHPDTLSSNYFWCVIQTKHFRH